MRLYVIILCGAILLTACSTPAQTGNVIDQGPVKSCSLPDFSCFVEQDGPNDVGFSLQNNLGFDLSSVTVTLNTTDCDIQTTSINLGDMPKDAITPVHFTCVSAMPDTLGASIAVGYVSTNGQTGAETGSLSIKN